MFKIKMQGQYGGAGDKKLSAVVRSTYNSYGFRQGIMRGFKVGRFGPAFIPHCLLTQSSPLQVTFVREIPAYAGFYFGYESSKRYFQNTVFAGQQLPVWAILTSGGTGGICYWLASYPLGVWLCRAPQIYQRGCAY